MAAARPSLIEKARRGGIRLVRFLYTDNGGVTRGKARAADQRGCEHELEQKDVHVPANIPEGSALTESAILRAERSWPPAPVVRPPPRRT